MQPRTGPAYLLAVVSVTLVVVLAGTMLAQSNRPTNVGIWTLNVAKSKVSAGTAAQSKRATFTVAVAGAGAKVTVDAVTADDTVRHWAYTANYDGKDYPITGNCQYGDAVAVTRLDANTTKSIYKQGGKVTITQDAVVSADRKTMTITGAGTNPLGQTVSSVAVYDRRMGG